MTNIIPKSERIDMENGTGWSLSVSTIPSPVLLKNSTLKIVYAINK